MILSNTSDVPVGSIIAYAGRISTAVSIPDDTNQTYPSATSETGLTNNMEGFGWMVCDGRQLYCSQYPQLFQAIGFLYNQSGDSESQEQAGEAKFRIPDYRGYFLRGASGSSGNDPDQMDRKFADGKQVSQSDDSVGSVQEDALQTHEHVYSKTTEVPVTAGQGPLEASNATEADFLSGDPTNSLTPSANTVRTSTETRSKNLSVHYLIKYCHVR